MHDAARDLISLPPLARAAVFLDFDGTLVDIADTPDAIRVPDDLTQLLNAVALGTGGALALVSGRAAADLARYLGGFTGPLVGGHGAEWRRDDRIAPRIDVDTRALTAMRHAAHRFADAHAGILVEEKPTGLVLHYRAAPDASVRVTTFAEALADTHPTFEAHPAKMAVEMRPRGVGKDRALADLMAGPPFAGRNPVMIGDDNTDEPAMAWVQARGGVAVKVGAGDSAAQHRLTDPAAVRRLLAQWT